MKLRVDALFFGECKFNSNIHVVVYGNSVSRRTIHKGKQQKHIQPKQQHTATEYCNNDWLPFENLCVSGEKETTNRRSKLINHFHFRFRWIVYSSLFLLHVFAAFYISVWPLCSACRALSFSPLLFVCVCVCVICFFFFTHTRRLIYVDALSSYSVVMMQRERKMNVCLICLAPHRMRCVRVHTWRG